MDTMALRGWNDFLDAQAAALDERILRGNGVSLVARQGDVAFLQIGDRAQAQEIEEAVSEFIRARRWPKLSFDQLRLLLLRTFMARRLVLSILEKKLDAAQCTHPLPENLGNEGGMIPWLLVDIWKAAGDEFKLTTITDFVRSRLSTELEPRRDKAGRSAGTAV